jgi:large subunit ribosomal protein L21
MYAIVDVKDKQFKVREDDTLYVPYHSDAEEDQQLTLDRVLLVSYEDGDVTLGTPTVEDASVSARVLEHVKGDKVIVFKKKRRKRYRVKRGHRQQYTQIQIESLNVNGAAPASTETDDSADTEPASATDETDEASPEPETAGEDSTDEADVETAETDASDADASDDESDSPEEPPEAEAADETAEADTDAVDDVFADEEDEDETDMDEAEDTESFSDDNPFDQETAFDDIDEDADDEKKSD